MRGGAVLLSVLVVASCGRYDFAELPAAEAPDGSVTPVRLTSTYYEVGGMPVESGIYDEALDAKCSFSEINGSVRCVPNGMLVVYADTACTQEIAAKQACDTDTRYVVRGDIASTGDPTTHVFRAGASRGVIATYIHNGDPNGCVPWATIETFDIGEEIATDTLVAATTEVVPGPRIDTVNYVSPEGMRQVAHYFDHDLGFNCDLSVAHTDYQCAPYEDIAYAKYSSTATCDDHVAASDTPPAAIQFHDIYNGCAVTDFSYYAVGGSITPSTLYRDTGTCSALGSVPAGPLYVSSGLLPLQPLVETNDAIPGQRVVRTRFIGGGVSAPFRLYDTQLGERCSPQTMSDGSVRCVPDGAYTTAMYTENTCTTLTTFATWQDFMNCSQPTFKYAIGGPRTACTSALDVYEIGPAFTGLFWVKDQSNNCTGPYSAGTGNPRYWQLGRKLDPSELVEATLP